MLVVKIELHSARDGHIEELGRMIIANDGEQGNGDIGDYDVRLGRKGVTENVYVYHSPQRKGRVVGHRRNAQSVWNLVAKALASVGFNPGKKVIESTNAAEDLLHK